MGVKRILRVATCEVNFLRYSAPLSDTHIIRQCTGKRFEFLAPKPMAHCNQQLVRDFSSSFFVSKIDS